ncbi:polyphosphate polymerase domain-containing protein [Membranihabitans marinus]|uniref:polyphosphate polymerase domain-containing protein n=1 Tax=Membranihabitans marinus TaxID=1227546 RepID=UPI001F2D0F44|nr:polyphosphate polymerase domain-containing protein [Membranihabitans marinus]
MTDDIIHKALLDYHKISLEEMNNVKLMDRVETKYVFSAKQLPIILGQLQNDYKVLRISGTETPTYKTIYFDTDSLYFYKEHHRKRKNRYKVRFRNYVDSNLTFLEVKHKQNGRVDKQRIKVDTDHFYLSNEDKRFLSKANIHQGELKKQLTNYYNRITLISKHSVERVTFDLNINFKYNDVETGLDQVVILELKQPQLSRSTPIVKVLKNLQIRPYNVSKYCIGLIKTHGVQEVKHNRFKKKLLQLNKINTI